jgi:hypothetical protein
LRTGQIRALLRKPEMLVGTWRAARGMAPEITEQEVRLAMERIEPLWDELFPTEPQPVRNTTLSVSLKTRV